MARADIKPAGTLTEMVSGRIRERIGKGELKPGDCVPSERELSRILSVSRVTARNGLNQLVTAGLLRREPGRGYFVRSRNGGGANKGAGTALVFVHAKPREEMERGAEHARMWEGAREEAAHAGMTVLVSPVEERVITREKADELSRVAAGVICDHTDAESIAALAAVGLPAVQMHYYREDVPVDAVVQDDFGGIRQAMKYLADHGHRRIGYLDTSAWLRSLDRGRNVEVRLGGYLIARGSLGLEEDDRLIAEVDGERRGALRELLAAGATAVVAPQGAAWRQSIEGVKLPADFGVVVWTGELESLQDGDAPTHIMWSREEMGRIAARMLLNRIEDPERAATTTLIRTELVDCGTGGRGPGARDQG